MPIVSSSFLFYEPSSPEFSNVAEIWEINHLDNPDIQNVTYVCKKINTLFFEWYQDTYRHKVALKKLMIEILLLLEGVIYDIQRII